MAAAILVTKLYVPPPPLKAVLRPRLIERLNEGLAAGRKLILISAPAGFGKTTVVSEWAAACEQPVAWLTDVAGNELAGGLVLSLRDFARLGQLLIEARATPTRSRIPGWFVETLTASSRAAGMPALSGLRKGSDLRYGFVRLGGAANRIAILGAHGTSLYIDFDRRLVVALYATHPQVRSPLQLASLERLWDAFGAAVPAVRKR